MLPIGHSKRFALTVAILLLGLTLHLGQARADEKSVARVSEVTGSATIERGFQTLAAATGTRLQSEDAIKTGEDGSIGIIFDDETTISLGPNSSLKIQSYVFNPGASEFSFVVRLFKGTAAYVSGLIAKLSPGSTEFITPSASIGIRGTRFVIQVDEI
jgi:hypothetical protein